jgi:hypothetical protein
VDSLQFSKKLSFITNNCYTTLLYNKSSPINFRRWNYNCADFSLKCQRNVNDVLLFNLKNNFSISAVILSNNYPRISRKMYFIIEENAFLLEYYFRNGVNRQPIKRVCIASIIMRTTQSKTNASVKKDKVALLICFLFDHLIKSL